MPTPNIFAQIRKVDEEKRLVYGRAAEEAVDKSDEIMDYMSSKPHFQKWSADVAADSGGKSLGNLRAMHGKVAAGLLKSIEFDDVAKTVDVCAHVVDDNEWKKVVAGVYTGFSIGGAYVGERKVEKMADGREAKRYTARPSELSLVDRPCMGGAKFFEVQKADGSLVKVDFVPEPVAEDLEIRGTNEQIIAFGKMMNTEGLTMADVLEKALPAFLAAKKKGDTPAADPKGDADKSDDDKAAAIAAAAVAAADAEKLEAIASDVALTKLEATLAELQPVLVKIGARNSAADTARLAKIHDSVVELGHKCAGAEKVAPAADLTKVDDADALAKAELAKAEGERLSKLVADALAPMQKLLDEQAGEIKVLKAQPATPTVRLRAVSKGEDMTGDETVAKVAPVVDASGKENETAGLIKGLHATGGQPLHTPLALRG